MLDTRRRHFITLLGGAAAWPLPGRAQQQTKIARIGILGLASAAAVAPYVNAVRAGLRDLGYIEGKNLIIEYRFGDGNYDRLPNLAALPATPTCATGLTAWRCWCKRRSSAMRTTGTFLCSAVGAAG